MKYKVVIEKLAEKFIVKLPKPEKEKVLQYKIIIPVYNNFNPAVS